MPGTCKSAIGAPLQSEAPRKGAWDFSSTGAVPALPLLQSARQSRASAAPLAMASSFQPSQEGVSQIVGLLTEVHKPGANQSEVRAWDGRLGAWQGCRDGVARSPHCPGPRCHGLGAAAACQLLPPRASAACCLPNLLL